MEQIAIMGIGTAVPACRLEQDDAMLRLKEALRERPESARWVHRLYAYCGVDTRYTCEPGLLETADRCRYLPSAPESNIPTTEERMAIYQKESGSLAADAAGKALTESRTRPSDITHLIVASCTGLFLPGLDTELAQLLDLPANVQRIPLTFTGCAAGLTALRVSMEITRANPEAKVLVVAVELCTLHIQPSFEKEDLFSTAIFGDGASACVVAMADDGYKGRFALQQARADLIPHTAGKMRWTIGNHGFRLHLSPEIPSLIGRYIPQAFGTFWEKHDLPELWAIHPGGRGIIDSLQTAFRLSDSHTAASRNILRQYGNMSSATILFVLDELRQAQTRTGEERKEGIAMAFGPGMTAEMLRFSLHL